MLEAALRWGLTGGLGGGAVAGLVVTLWVVPLARPPGMTITVEHITLRSVSITMIGLFLGLTVRQLHVVRKAAQRTLALTPDVIAALDLQGILRAVNPACERLFGYTSGELLGRHYEDLLHPDDQIRGSFASSATSHCSNRTWTRSSPSTSRDGSPR